MQPLGKFQQDFRWHCVANGEMSQQSFKLIAYFFRLERLTLRYGIC